MAEIRVCVGARRRQARAMMEREDFDVESNMVGSVGGLFFCTQSVPPAMASENSVQPTKSLQDSGDRGWGDARWRGEGCPHGCDLEGLTATRTG